MPGRALFTLRYDQDFVDQLRAEDRKYRSLILRTIEEQLRHEPLTETRNRKPLRREVQSGARWELRFGPANRFRVLFRVDESSSEVFVLALGVKDGNRLRVAGEEI